MILLSCPEVENKRLRLARERLLQCEMLPMSPLSLAMECRVSLLSNALCTKTLNDETPGKSIEAATEKKGMKPSYILMCFL